MAASGHQRARDANLRLLTLWEETRSDEFATEFRDVTLAKTDDGDWTVTDDGRLLDEFSKEDFDDAREWINHINGLAKHGEDYLAIVEGDR